MSGGELVVCGIAKLTIPLMLLCVVMGGVMVNRDGVSEDGLGHRGDAVPAWTKDFDHLAPGVGDVIHELTAQLRADCPVARSSSYGGFFVVAGAREVGLVAKQDQTFSSAVEGLGATMVLPALERVAAPLFESDPPVHTLWRRAMQPFFTPAAAAAYEPGIRRVTGEVLVGLAPRGHADLVAEFAMVVAPLVTAAVLGVPDADRAMFAALIRDLFTEALSGQAGGSAGQELAEVLLELVRARRGAPVHDVLGAVANTFINGVPASDEELLKHAFLLVAAGTLTSGDTIANTACVLGSDPDLRARVMDDRTLLTAVVEESVRHESAVAATGRTVRHSSTLSGVDLVEGDRVLLLWGSANRDEALFPDGDRFRLDRPYPGRHLGWGAGAHHCLGKHLARLQVRVVLDELLEVLGDFEVEPGFTPRRTFGVLRGLVTLPARWAAVDRRSPMGG
ncbi:cytochrome P450 [Saccharothrix lopnurensis]|uniref:Cytochrome P450 n=1 Tax=Saccharothrix lopnurensis TaxID=1670621 RepID=A0ABW1PHG0_9PSEU